MINEPLAVIHIDGVDATKFLQSQLTCDVAAILAEQCQLAAYCNQKGYVEALFWLQRTASGFRALIRADLVDNTLALFKKYGAFSKVSFHLDTMAQVAFTLSQQESPLHWQETLTLALPMSTLMSAQTTADTKWRAYWLNLRVPMLTQATRGLFRPHELHLPELGAVCFTKGCYPGQEIVARMHYRGKAKAHAQQLRLNACITPPMPGDIVLHGDTACATVIDCLSLKDQCYHISAVIQDSAYDQLPFSCQWGELSAVNHD